MAATTPPRTRVNPEYTAFSKALKKPGMQKGEKETLAAIAAKRGVSVKEAKAIAVKRTALGRNVGGVKRGVVERQVLDAEGNLTSTVKKKVSMRRPGVKAGRSKPKA